MLHDIALYKFNIDTDIGIERTKFKNKRATKI